MIAFIFIVLKCASDTQQGTLLDKVMPCDALNPLCKADAVSTGEGRAGEVGVNKGWHR